MTCYPSASNLWGIFAKVGQNFDFVPSLIFGLSTYNLVGAIRNLRVRMDRFQLDLISALVV